MDNSINLLTSVQKKPTKKTNKKTKHQPVKVVYISNPMKIKTSASQFRALVQELTGQDADFPDPTKFPATYDQDQLGFCTTVKIDGEEQYHHHHDGGVVMGNNSTEEQPAESNNSSNTTSTTTTTTTTNSRYEAFEDDVFMPQMMESFAGAWYESPNNFYHQVHHDLIRTLDAM